MDNINCVIVCPWRNKKRLKVVKWIFKHICKLNVTGTGDFMLKETEKRIVMLDAITVEVPKARFKQLKAAFKKYNNYEEIKFLDQDNWYGLTPKEI